MIPIPPFSSMILFIFWVSLEACIGFFTGKIWKSHQRYKSLLDSFLGVLGFLAGMYVSWSSLLAVSNKGQAARFNFLSKVLASVGILDIIAEYTMTVATVGAITFVVIWNVVLGRCSSKWEGGGIRI